MTLVGRISRIASLALALLAASVASAGDDALYWMVDDSATVNEWWSGGRGEIGIEEFFGTPTEGSAYAARIRVTGGDITKDTFLQLYYTGGTIDDGEFGVDFEDAGGGYWGAGVPTGNQSPSQAYSADSPEYSFIVELGNIVNDEWTTIATSEASTYSELRNDYIHPTYDLTPSAWQIWMPTSFTAVPEPSSGLLTLLGLAVLALRRKRLAEGV